MTTISDQCPRCAGSFSAQSFEVEADPIDVARCQACGGIFCSSQAYEQLLDTPDTDSLDTGRNGADEETFIEKMTCPQCDDVMATYRYPPQPHIKIDRCASCLSVFLDAGELKDMKHYTLIDWFRDLPYN